MGWVGDMSRRFQILLALLLMGPFSARAAKSVEFEVTTAPFQITKKYKSMEGPMVVVPITIDGLLTADGPFDLPVAATEENPLVWIRERPQAEPATPRELWWFLGAEIEALHPTEEKPVSSEFICHLNIDVDQEARAERFPSSPGGSSRLLTLTGGATNFQLPDGFGVPVASDETLTVYFQALNHNLAGAHRFRHRLTLRFLRDLDCSRSPTPLNFHWPSIAVPVAETEEAGSVPVGSCACCAPATAGENAPANSANGMFTGPQDRTFTGHWLVPPGESEWRFPVNYYSPDFAAYDSTIHALIPHLHPFATELELIAHRAGCDTPETVARLGVKNQKNGIGLEQIEIASLPEGLPIAAEDEYELRVAYDNRSDEIQDSMATLGIFTEDHRWQRPAWADARFGGEPPTCGIPPPPGRKTGGSE